MYKYIEECTRGSMDDSGVETVKYLPKCLS